jgi:rfaE bifunctional protein kinase chain/domain
MNSSHKIISISNSTDLTKINVEKETVVCFGHFNVIHPGHIRFLQYAKSKGKRLLVCIVGDHIIKGGQRSKYFPQHERAEGVASLHIVDQVLVMDEFELVDIIRSIKPDTFVLGSEFERTEQKDIKEVISIVEGFGGTVVFHAGEVHYANADLLHGSQEDLESEKMSLFLQSCKRQGIQLNQLIERIHDFSKAKILVLGDTIVDQYVACDAIGMSAEAPVLVVRELESKEFVGGAGVVAAHLCALGAKPIFLSVVGNDSNAEIVRTELEKQGVDVHLIADDSRPTTFKIRYMVENQKLFRVSRLKEHSISKQIEDKLIEKLQSLSKNINGILISDFVYGIITKRVLDEVQKIAEAKKLFLFGDLQCSSQVGDVTKFLNFDLLCPTEREARIALGNQHDGVEWIANTMLQKTNSKNLLIKLGADGFISYSKQAADGFVNKEHFPALVTNPVDVAGAGDSLLSAIAAAMSSGAGLMESSAIGACMAALAVQTIGNVPISSQKLINYIKQLGK